MSKQKAPEELNDAQKRFCQEYVYDFNGTRAYQKAYPESSYEAAMSSASDLLRNPKVQSYCEELQSDIAKLAGVSRLMVLKEHQKLAFNSIAHLHQTWITRKEFNDLTDEQKDCISEISTQIKTTRNSDGSLSENEYVKVRIYDKQKALEAISKMLGYNEPDKKDITSGGEKISGFKIVIEDPTEEKKK